MLGTLTVFPSPLHLNYLVAGTTFAQDDPSASWGVTRISPAFQPVPLGQHQSPDVQQGGREQVRAATRRSRESRVDRVRSSISRFDWSGDMDAAGPIVAACASVEWLQLLISPEVCPEES